MKKIYGFAFAAALVSLASCSNENEPIANNPNPTPEEDVQGYVAINIVNPSGTRADSEDGQFVDGVTGENKAESGTFLFFDAYGKSTQAPQTVRFTDEDWSDSTDEGIEKVSSAMVVVGGRDTSAGTAEDPYTHKPSQLLVILNDPSTNIYADYATLGLKDVLELVTSAAYSTTNKFIMTNAFGNFETSITDSEGKVTTTKKMGVATDISNNVFPSRDEAKNNAVNIYVERLAAKVDYTIASNAIKGTGDFAVNGETNKISLKPVVKGVNLANQAKSEYLFKNIDENLVKDATASAWIFANDYRSNWATSAEQKDGYTNFSWTQYTSPTKLPTEFYVRENTGYTSDAEKNPAQYTSLLVAAELQDADGNPYSLVRWAGIYFTPENYKTQALNFISEYYKKAATYTEENKEYVSLQAADLDYLGVEALNKAIDEGDLESYEQALTLVDPKIELFTKKTENGVDTFEEAKDGVKTINDRLASEQYRVWYWNNGQTYYFVKVQHKGIKSAEGASPAYDFSTGIVRNNWYKINVTNISGLGTPVFDPDRVIIPETPEETLWYMGAKINILNWRVVKQDADMNQVPL